MSAHERRSCSTNPSALFSCSLDQIFQETPSYIWCRNVLTEWIHTCWKTLFWGVFAERSLGSQLKFSAGSARPPPCNMQSTTAHLCSTQRSFCGAVLGQSAQILSQQRSATPLSHAVDRGSPVLHAPRSSTVLMEPLFWTWQHLTRIQLATSGVCKLVNLNSFHFLICWLYLYNWAID